jgi:hypothetical protein
MTLSAGVRLGPYEILETHRGWRHGRGVQGSRDAAGPDGPSSFLQNSLCINSRRRRALLLR